MKTLAFFVLAFFLLGCIQQLVLPANSSREPICGVGTSCVGNQSVASEPAYSLAFSAIDLEGKPITQEQFKGKVIVAQGFASWCTSCAVEAEAIKQVYSEFAGKGVEVLYFDVMPNGEPVEQVRAFRSQYGDAKWHWIAQANELPAKLGARSFDYTAVIDARGNIVYQDNKLTDPGELRQAIAKVLGRWDNV